MSGAPLFVAKQRNAYRYKTFNHSLFAQADKGDPTARRGRLRSHQHGNAVRLST